MPTGYTADIAKGIDFKTYALRCSRNFGALIMMRDEKTDAPIPDEFEPSDHHQKNLKEYQDKLTRFNSLTHEELLSDYEQYKQQETDYRIKSDQDKGELKQKYESMLAHVNAYQSPSPDHDKFKEFMRTQIEESIKFDCSVYEREPIMSFEDWRLKQLKSINWSIEYHTVEHAKEIKRTNDRNKWIKLLKESLQ